MPYLNKKPFIPWIVQFILSDQIKPEAHVVQVLKSVKHSILGDDTVKQIYDGDVSINAVFSRNALSDFKEQCDDDDSPPSWDRSTIILQEYSLKHLLHTQLEKCEFTLCVDRFSLWTIDVGFRPKCTPVDCMTVRAVITHSRTLWTQAKSATDTEYSMSSVPLSQLIEHLTQESQEPESAPGASHISHQDIIVQEIHSVTMVTQNAEMGQASVDRTEVSGSQHYNPQGVQALSPLRQQSRSSSQEEFHTPMSSPGGGTEKRPGNQISNKSSRDPSNDTKRMNISQPDSNDERKWMIAEQFIISDKDQHILDFLPDWRLTPFHMSTGKGASLSPRQQNKPKRSHHVVQSGPAYVSQSGPTPTKATGSKTAAELNLSRRSSTEFPWLATSTLDVEDERGSSKQEEDDLRLSMDEEDEEEGGEAAGKHPLMSSTPAEKPKGKRTVLQTHHGQSPTCKHKSTVMVNSPQLHEIKCGTKRQTKNKSPPQAEVRKGLSTTPKRGCESESRNTKITKENADTATQDEIQILSSSCPMEVVKISDPLPSGDILPSKQQGVTESEAEVIILTESSEVIEVCSSGETTTDKSVRNGISGNGSLGQKENHHGDKTRHAQKQNPKRRRVAGDMSDTLYSSPDSSTPQKYHHWTCQTPGSDEEMLQAAQRSPDSQEQVQVLDKSLCNIARQYNVIDETPRFLVEDKLRSNLNSADSQVVQSSEDLSLQRNATEEITENISFLSPHCAVQSTQNPQCVLSQLPELSLSPVGSQQTASQDSKKGSQGVVPATDEIEETKRLGNLVRKSNIESTELVERQRLLDMNSLGGSKDTERSLEIEEEEESQSQSLLAQPAGHTVGVKTTTKVTGTHDQNKSQIEIPDSTSENSQHQKKGNKSQKPTATNKAINDPPDLMKLYPGKYSAKKKKCDVSVMYGSAKKASHDSLATEGNLKGKRKLFNMDTVLEEVPKDLDQGKSVESNKHEEREEQDNISSKNDKGSDNNKPSDKQKPSTELLEVASLGVESSVLPDASVDQGDTEASSRQATSPDLRDELQPSQAMHVSGNISQNIVDSIVSGSRRRIRSVLPLNYSQRSLSNRKMKSVKIRRDCKPTQDDREPRKQVETTAEINVCQIAQEQVSPNDTSGFSLRSALTPYNSLPGNQLARSTYISQTPYNSLPCNQLTRNTNTTRDQSTDSTRRNTTDQNASNSFSFNHLFSDQASTEKQFLEFLTRENLIPNPNSALFTVNFSHQTETFINNYFKV